MFSSASANNRPNSINEWSIVAWDGNKFWLRFKDVQYGRKLHFHNLIFPFSCVFIIMGLLFMMVILKEATVFPCNGSTRVQTNMRNENNFKHPLNANYGVKNWITFEIDLEETFEKTVRNKLCKTIKYLIISCFVAIDNDSLRKFGTFYSFHCENNSQSDKA